jgi:nicotinamide phosphoribosyltransferase
MKLICPIFNATDFYKVDHRRQYPDNTTLIYSNLTARGSRVTGIDKIVNFGAQFFIKRFLIEAFNESFFSQPKEKVVAEYKRRMDTSLGADTVPMDHVIALHDLGYLPLEIKTLPEGDLVPLQVPFLTVVNTHPDFFWLTNFIETLLSCTIWGMVTSATVAFEYRKNFEHWAKVTGAPKGMIPWLGHSFAFRGMFGLEAAAMSDAGHLLSFQGTDTIPGIDLLESYYNANSNWQMVGGSVPATEHSVGSSVATSYADSDSIEEEFNEVTGQWEFVQFAKDVRPSKNRNRQVTQSEKLFFGELLAYKRLITKVYPKGIVSIVSDTFDFWAVVTKIIPSLKKEILSRDGKVVIRPDSGDPVKIIVGDPEELDGTPANKGLIQCLWDTFGGTTTPEGYKMLDSHIGAIYGDSITIARQKAILEGLAAKGFASSNVVLGIGSYTYQYTTRDTFGMAIKSTYAEINGNPTPIFKQPKTDSGKNSHKGLMCVTGTSGKYKVEQDVSWEREKSPDNQLKTVFLDGKMVSEVSLKQLRERIEHNLLLI